MIEKSAEGYELESTTSTRTAGPLTTPTPQPPSNTFAQVAYERRLRRDSDRERSIQDAARDAYRIPILMFAIGAAGVCVINYFAFGGATVGAYLLGYLASVPIGLGVYLLCCAVWIGFNDPIHLIALNLAGIYAVSDLVSTSLGFLPVFGLFAWIISAGVYVGLLSQLLEIELGEAIVVGLLTFLAKLIIAMAIVSAVA